MFEQKKKKNQNCMDTSDAIGSSTHSFASHIDYSRNVSLKITEIAKFHIFLIFHCSVRKFLIFLFN